MDSKEEDDLKDDLSHDRLPEVEGPVHHHGPKLDQHHDQEGPWNLVFRQGRRDVSCGVFLKEKQMPGLKVGSGRVGSLRDQTHPKGGVSKHNDDEVDCVSKKHQHVDVRDCAVLWVDQVMEELPHGKVDLHEPAENTISYLRNKITSSD